MRVNRENLLGVLESITPGLAAREILEQSSCFVFMGPRVCTFNDEVFCSKKSPIPEITGAVTAKPLLDLLSKLKEDEIDVEQKDGELLVKGKGRRAAVRMEAKVSLPVDTIEIPEEWIPISEEFCEAVGVVSPCASSDESQFKLTCVHVHPKHLEACDRFQLARYPLETGLSEPTLVRAVSIAKIAPCGMTEMSSTKAWLHFRNPSGLVVSCRRFLEEYVNLDKFLEKTGTSKITLPGGLEEAVSKAEIFSGDNSVGNHVAVDLTQDLLEIKGEGASGWFKERVKVSYDGPPIKFLVAPKLLLRISKKANECGIDTGRLLVDTGKFVYTTCTVVPDQPKKEDGEKSSD